MEKLLEEVEEASLELNDARLSARINVVGAIRAVERMIVESLAGERLKGLPNLTQGKTKAFYAARLRGAIDAPLPPPVQGEPVGRTVVVIDDSGMLMIANRNYRGHVVSYVAEDSDIVAEDIQEYISRMSSILQTHIAMCGRGCDKYNRFNKLANGLRKLLLDVIMSDK